MLYIEVRNCEISDTSQIFFVFLCFISEIVKIVDLIKLNAIFGRRKKKAINDYCKLAE